MKQRSPRFNPTIDEQALIIDLLREGSSYSQIGRKLNVEWYIIGNYVRRMTLAGDKIMKQAVARKSEIILENRRPPPVYLGDIIQKKAIEELGETPEARSAKNLEWMEAEGFFYKVPSKTIRIYV
jgi:hypothetical protein